MKSRRPNVIITIADDQRFDMLGCLGRGPVQTPHLDLLASRGCLLESVYHNGASCGAVCAPCRCMILTGRPLFQLPHDELIRFNKDYDYWSYSKVTTSDLTFLPEYFRQNGYSTFHSGKWHNDTKAFIRCFEKAEAIFLGGMTQDHWKVPLHPFDPDGVFPEEKIQSGTEYSTTLFSDSAARFIDEYDDERPFFMWVAFMSPHDPRTAQPPFDKMYDPHAMELPPNFAPRHPFDSGALTGRDEDLAAHPRDPAEIRRHQADYFAMVSSLDDGIGKIHQALERKGFLKNTLVIHTSDHGLAVGQHGLLGKQSVYEHSIKVPMILSGPGINPGARSASLIQSYDLFPTLCDLVGLPIPETVKGKSFHGVLKSANHHHRDRVYSAYRCLFRSVRDQRFKLIECYPHQDKKNGGIRKTLLFDLISDPWEIQNLADQPNYAETLRGLQSDLKCWQEEVGDPQISR